MQNQLTRNSSCNDDCSTFDFLTGGWEVVLLVLAATSSTSDIMVLSRMSTNIA